MSLKTLKKKGIHDYDSIMKGVIHIRTDGTTLVAGRVYGSTKLANRENPNGYKWDYSKFKL